MKPLSLLTVSAFALVMLAAPQPAQSDEGRTASYGSSIRSAVETPVRRVVSRAKTPSANSNFVRRSQADKARAAGEVARHSQQDFGATTAGDNVRRNFGFKSSPEVDEVSRASILNGRRLDARSSVHQPDSSARIQELGF